MRKHDSPHALLSRFQRSALAAVLGLLCSLAEPSGASAQDPAKVPGKRFALNWVRLAGAETCIAPADLARSVEARLQRSVFGALSSSEVTIEGHVGPTRGERFRVLLSMTDERGRVSGSREFLSEPGHCSELDAALVLTLALLIDPNADLSGPTPVRRKRRTNPPATRLEA
ncbi:MAG TPA: hypothetical protein VK524_27390, partial [Polyangiaceae bacterium]|nr:hypothetical protein [Polyangiaceae bacterium]